MIADLLLVLHLLGAVLWVGGMFFALVVLRPSLAVVDGPARLELHRQVFRRFFTVIWHVMPVMLATGFAMVFLIYGGFRGAQWNVHLMTLLGLVMSALFVAVFFGPWATLRRGGDAASVDRIRRLVQVNLVLGLIVVVVAALNY